MVTVERMKMLSTLYQDPALCGRPGRGQDVEANGFCTLQAGDEGRRGYERLQGHHHSLGTWLGHCLSASVSWCSFFHVKQTLQTPSHLQERERERETHTSYLISWSNNLISFHYFSQEKKERKKKSLSSALSTGCTLCINYYYSFSTK